MEYEIFLLLIAAGTGALLLLGYEALAAFRAKVPHHPFVSAAEDLLYWVLTGIFMFSVLYRCNRGILRLFFFPGCFAGVFICRYTVAGLFRKGMEAVLGIPVFFVKISTKWLIFLVKRCSIFVCRIARPVKTTGIMIFCGVKRISRVKKEQKQEKQKENSE